MATAWLIWSYIWRVAVNVVTLVVAWIILSGAHNRIEGMVLAFGVLLYAMLRSIWMGLIWHQHSVFKPVYRMLLRNDPDLTNDDLREVYREQERAELHSNIKMLVNAVFFGLIYVSGLLSLFTALGRYDF
jgi:hypothetical protein